MSTEINLWIISLVIGLVVIGVVAFLLHLIKSTAKKIDNVASEIWTHGKLTANNTVHIPLFLTTTNKVITNVLGTAVKILGGSKVITQHIEGCPGCPQCVLKHSNT